MSVQFVPCSNGLIPTGAVVVGHDMDGSPLYAGRARHEGDLLPAKVKPNHSGAYVAWGGREYCKHEYEVMVASNVSWQRSCDGYIPAHAIVVGKTVVGEKLYMGRAYCNGTLSPGKVQPSHCCLYIPYGGTEIAVTEYEIMVADVPPSQPRPLRPATMDNSSKIIVVTMVSMLLIFGITIFSLEWF